MTSIRRTLTWSLVMGIGAAALLAFAGLYISVRAALTRQFDETLEARAAAMISATRWDEDHFQVDFDPEVMPWFKPGEAPEYFDLREFEAGESPAGLILVSPSLFAIGSGARLSFQGDGAIPAMLPDGRAGRLLGRRFHAIADDPTDAEQLAAAAAAPELLLIVAKGREELDRILGLLGLSLLATLACLAVGVVMVVAASLARGLRPLDRLSGEVVAMGAESLSRRLDDSGLPAELVPIARRLNELFGRLAAAFERERRFTGAAAHELRTPIAELRALAEVSLSRARTGEESRAALTEALAVSLQMERLVSSLFTLARHDGSAARASVMRTDLAPLLGRICERHAHEAHGRWGHIVVQADESLPVLADEQALESILNNVIGNAVVHASPRPEVRVRAGATPDGWVEVTVSNPAANIGPSDVERFFEPFWRKSESRTEREHLGLGLALSQRFAESMSGTLTAEMDRPGWVRVRLRLASRAEGG